MSGLAVIRADATPVLGAGHVARCSRIADALIRLGWQCAFAVSAETPRTAPLLGGQAYETFILKGGDEPSELAARWPDGCDLLIVDHYQRDATFEHSCRPWAQRVIAIEDLGRAHDIDLMVDPGAVNISDKRGPAGLYLGGPAYAALHPAFAAQRKSAAARDRGVEPKRIVVSFGGGDVDTITTSVAEAVAEALPHLSLDIVLGTAGPARDDSLTRLEKLGEPVQIHRGHGATQMAELMARSDIAIGAAGGTSWERCCLSLPSGVAVIAENQRGNAKLLEDKGAAATTDLVECGTLSSGVPQIVDIISALVEDGPRRSAMANAAGSVCDGLGASRIAAILDVNAMAPDGSAIWFRPADNRDTDIMLDWQNEPGTRIFAHDPRPPEPEAHRRWMTSKLHDPDCIFSVVMCGRDPAGVVRLDRCENLTGVGSRYLVSILIPTRCQRQGLGLAALAMARRLAPDAEILAEILPANGASIALFEKAGYCRKDEFSYVMPPMALPGERQRLPA